MNFACFTQINHFQQYSVSHGERNEETCDEWQENKKQTGESREEKQEIGKIF